MELYYCRLVKPDPEKLRFWEARAAAYDRLCRRWEIFSELSNRLIDLLPADLHGAVPAFISWSEAILHEGHAPPSDRASSRLHLTHCASRIQREKCSSRKMPHWRIGSVSLYFHHVRVSMERSQ